MIDYLEFAQVTARDAGEIMKRYFLSDELDTEWKDDNTPLTVADTAINTMVINRVKEEYPEHGVWGEEESFGLDSKYIWVCDPIDGTMPFSIGLPISTFSLALVDKKTGQPQVAVVYNPTVEQLFHAEVGTGAYMNGQQIHVSGKSNLENAYIDEEVWGTADEHLIPLEGVRYKLLKSGAKPFSLSSGVVAGSLIAAGKMAGMIFAVKKPEDIAALKLIVEEAGGKVTDIEGNEQRYDEITNGAVVSNGLVHEKLLEIVKESRP